MAVDDLVNVRPATEAGAPVASAAPPHPGMVWVTGGTFMMGSDHHYAEEAPAHKVTVDGFWIDQYTVTNRDFAVFVKATGHLTVAERAVDPADYPGVGPDMLQPSSAVFVKPQRRVDLANPYLWWTYVQGANWRHPEGPSSSVKRRPDHPAVHLAWADAAAYARWAGKEIPTEAEWEYAARGGLDGATYAWGEEFTLGGWPRRSRISPTARPALRRCHIRLRADLTPEMWKAGTADAAERLSLPDIDERAPRRPEVQRSPPRTTGHRHPRGSPG
jgi:formylglycine-generating enzyme required for sulfatase activity